MSIVNYGVSKHYAGSMVSDRCPLGYLLNKYLSNEKNTFADNSRVEPTIFLMEKLSFSLKLFSGNFYGQSFVKTVRGPLLLDHQTYGSIFILISNEMVNTGDHTVTNIDFQCLLFPNDH